MWTALYKFLLLPNPNTVLYEISGWVIRNIADPVNEIAYKFHLTKHKPISKLSVNDFLNG